MPSSFVFDLTTLPLSSLKVDSPVLSLALTEKSSPWMLTVSDPSRFFLTETGAWHPDMRAADMQLPTKRNLFIVSILSNSVLICWYGP